MNNQQTLMLALFIALGAVLVTGLIAIPSVIEEADAKECKDKNDNGVIEYNECKLKTKPPTTEE